MTDERGRLADAAPEFPSCPRRGPLRSVVLAATGQDVRLCGSCSNCECLLEPGMDLSLGEIVRAAARNDTSILSSPSLWACEDLLLRPIPCQAGLSLAAIILTLQREAEVRGLVANPGSDIA